MAAVNPHAQPAAAPDAPDALLGEDLGNLAETVVIKERNLFLVSFRDGRLPSGQRHPLGLYWCDCRFLNVHELRLGGLLPRLLVASDELGTLAVHESTNPDLPLPEGGVVPAQSLQLRVERGFAGPQRMREVITVRSYHHERLRLPLELRIGADFEQMMAIRGVVKPDGPIHPRVEANGAGVRIEAEGRDGVRRFLELAPSVAPDEVRAGVLVFELDLEQGEQHTIELVYSVGEGDGQAADPPAPRRDGAAASPGTASRDGGGAAAASVAWLAERTRASSDDELFDRIVRRSLLDLWLLRSEIEGNRYYAAGIPWYATLFGRDSLITASEVLSFGPEVAEETLRLLGGRLGRVLDDERDEEPGKVLHELRVGELARLGNSPFARYYGSVDATPLFLCLLCDYSDWSGDLALFEELRDQVDAALGWIDRFGDLDGDGLIEYRRRAPDGLRNQGWKDSHDGVMDGDGVPLEPPIALAEVQGYARRAKQGLARLFDLAGEGSRAEQLRREADELGERIERFWLPEHGFYSMALDPDKRPSPVLASNQGHLLWAQAVPPERAAGVRDSLMSERMFTGWGVRTLAEGEPGYNPVGYHTGSVWPHDNAMVAHGLRRYGYDEDFTRIFEGLLEAASRFPDYRLPELFAGFSRGEYESPVPYPVACHPQAWAAATIPYLLKWGLGLAADGLERRLRIVRPSLPRWINRVDLEGLRVAGATVDLRFERSGAGVTLADARIDGDLEVVLEIAPERGVVDADPGGRFPAGRTEAPGEGQM